MTDQKKCDNQDYEKHRFQLLLSFHQQFAENQNHHQNVLFKLIALLVTVIVGYGYALQKSYDEYTTAGVIFLVAEFFLTIGLALTCNMAYGFRRDQLVNYKIRKEYKLIAEEEKDNQKYIFPASYKPGHEFILKRIKLFNWMPEFHKILAIAFLVFQVFLIVTLPYYDDSHVGYLLRSLALILPIAIVSVAILYYFKRKIKKLYETH